MSRLDNFVDHARDPQAETWIAHDPYWEIDEIYGHEATDPAIELAQAIQSEPIEKVLCLDLAL